MAFGSWRGTVGVIKPTFRPGSLEDFIRLLPEGVGVIPLFTGASKGTVEEFRDPSVMEAYEERVRQLAGLGVDLIHPEGGPPFMVRGHQGERQIIDRWEAAYGVPVVTTGTTQVEAMRALGITRPVGVTYFRGQINDLFSRYLTDAGFKVEAMEGIDVGFTNVGMLSSHQVYAHTKKAFLSHTGADGIYILGSGWRVMDILEMLEEDLDVPVVHPVAARVWAVENHLRIRKKTPGFGRLLADLPSPVRP